VARAWLSLNPDAHDNSQPDTRMTDANEPAGFEIPCRNLRNKEMYYQAPEEDEYASGIFWCGKTHESFGPDGEPVSKKQCCEGRSCYLR